MTVGIGEMPDFQVLLLEQCHIDGGAPIELEHREPEADSELQGVPVEQPLLCPGPESPVLLVASGHQPEVVIPDTQHVVLVHIRFPVGLLGQFGVFQFVEAIVLCRQQS